MSVRKRFLSAALCLCMLLCISGVGVGTYAYAADGTHDSHPICGKTHTDIGNHTSDQCQAVEWIALTQSAVDEAGGTMTLESGKSYYLSESITAQDSVVLSGGTVNLCLNGKKLTVPIEQIRMGSYTVGGVIWVDGGAVLNICDCEGTGSILCEGTDEPLFQKCTVYCLRTGALNLFGGNIIRTGGVHGRAVEITNFAAFKMYGGTVHNQNDDSSRPAVNSKTSASSEFPVRIYGGEIISDSGYGLAMDTYNADVLIEGGTISGGRCAVYINADGDALTLGGSPNLCVTGSDPEAVLYLTDRPDFVIIRDDFAPAQPISVREFDNSEFARPAAQDGTLEEKADYFVSATEGYFVECADKNLRLTACRITQQPAAENDYTVMANGSPVYQWYKAVKGTVLVTNENAVDSASYFWSDRWSGSLSEGWTEVFTLSMKKDDPLRLTFSSGGDIGIEDVDIFDTVSGERSNNVERSSSETGETVYTLTAPASGNYTLKLRLGEGRVPGGMGWFRFSADTVAYVPDTVLRGQSAATLNTAGLQSGVYICQVTWENKTTRASAEVTYLHTHVWKNEWESNDIQHWHKCEGAGCDAVSEKGDHVYENDRDADCNTCGYRRTIAPQPSGSGKGGSTASTVPVPVIGSRSTVSVSASVSGGTAEIKEIKADELEKIGTDGSVILDLSSLGRSITGVTLPADTLRALSDSGVGSMEIALPHARLQLDKKTLAALAAQLTGRDIRLVVETDSKAKSTMSAAQKQALDGMKNAAALEAYFVSGGQRITDFNGGEVELSIPYQASGAIRAWYLREGGTRESVAVHYDRENARLTLRHFSHYVIEELDGGAEYAICTKDNSCPLAAFSDLNPTAWYHDGIHYCLENGLMQGISGGTFLPDGGTSRAQLVTILWRMEGGPEKSSTVSFRDVEEDAWFAEAVHWAAAEGIVQGLGGERFAPDDKVTREQMVTVLWRFAKYKGDDVSIGEDTNILSYADAFSVSDYAIPAMQWACGSGMVNGIEKKDGLFLEPGGMTTRAQTASLMMRFCAEQMK